MQDCRICWAYRCEHWRSACGSTGSACGWLPAAALAQPAADLELVIAVDVSLSMDLDEQRLQRDGYVAAFRDPEVHKAIVSGPNGRIVVTYMEWAGPPTQQVVMPWTIIDSPAAARAFADRLEALPISRARMTSISAALQFSARLFESSGARGIRRVIDVSGDGPNNAGAAGGAGARRTGRARASSSTACRSCSSWPSGLLRPCRSRPLLRRLRHRRDRERS